jgi:SSS family solute:Na+ symporter
METSVLPPVPVDPGVIISFSVYIIIIFSIGLLSMRYSSKGMTEFFLGGRGMHKVVVALSAVVSGRSSWLLIGVTGMAYKMGISAIWAIVGYTVVEFAMFMWAAPRLRRQTENQGDLTVPDYFESRYKDTSHVLRLIASIIILVFLTDYISAQCVGGGKTLSESFNIPVTGGIFLTAGIIMFYTILGGFRAVALVDVIHACFMITGLVILPIVAIFDLGGVSEFWQALKGADAKFVNLFALSAGAMIGLVGIGLGSPGNPHIIVRYMAVKDPKDLKFSAWVGTFWNVVMGVAAVLIGCIGRAYFPVASKLPCGEPEKLYPYLAEQHLHPVIVGVIIASVLAAIMSTADSMLLVCASTVIQDLYVKTFKPGRKLSDRALVILSRCIIVIIMLIALGIGLVAIHWPAFEKQVFWLVLIAWGGLGASLGPALLLSLFWNKTRKEGIAAGFITGAAVLITWELVPVLDAYMYSLVPAFTASLIVTVLVSLMVSVFKKKHA